MDARCGSLAQLLLLLVVQADKRFLLFGHNYFRTPGFVLPGVKRASELSQVGYRVRPNPAINNSSCVNVVSIN